MLNKITNCVATNEWLLLLAMLITAVVTWFALLNAKEKVRELLAQRKKARDERRLHSDRYLESNAKVITRKASTVFCILV